MRHHIRPPSHAQTRRRALILGTFSTAVVVTALTLSIANQRPRLDESTLCPRDLRLDTSVVALVDTTDALDPIQRSRLLADVDNERDILPIYGKFTLLFLNAENPYEPKQLVSLCNPGSGRGLNPLFNTTSKLERRWKASFAAPIERAVADLATAPTAPRSPIMDTLAAATARPDFDARVTNRRLLVISDLLEHDPGDYSQYHSRNLWEDYLRSRLAAQPQPDFSRTVVEIEYLQRPSTARLQNDTHREFWRRWFTANGATSVDFKGVRDPRMRGAVAEVANRERAGR